MKTDLWERYGNNHKAMESCKKSSEVNAKPNYAKHQTVGVELVARGLCRSFGGEKVLDGIDLEVRTGEILVIIGASGSGKTVLLRHLVGLETPDAGEVFINGLPISSPETTATYRLALVFQSGALLQSLTVGENIGLYLSEHHLKSSAEIEEIVSKKLADFGLTNESNKMPSELSGGTIKRVAIIRALVMEPQMIFYDEPTSELDPPSAVVVGREILNLKHRFHVTSLVVSHDRELAFGIADRIAFLDDGKILTSGTPNELKMCEDPRVQKFLRADFKRG